jgi:uncharacterized membrane protein YcaP (DUF421 family)
MDVVWRATAIYFFLFVFTRALGKRELAEMSAFELIVLVTMGDMVQQGVTQEDFSMTGAMLAVSTFGLLALATAYTGFKFRRARPLLEGRPVVVLHNGRWLDDALRVERLHREEVVEAARNQGITDLATVTVGVLEPDGKFSFLTGDGDRHDQPDKTA